MIRFADWCKIKSAIEIYDELEKKNIPSSVVLWLIFATFFSYYYDTFYDH